MQYLIDGYNLLFFQLHPGENLRRERESLIFKLTQYIERLKWDVTIVFDSQYQDNEGSSNHYKNIRICFTDFNQTADELIVSYVKQSKKPSNITVVTSDQKLSWYCRLELAKTMSVRDFTTQLISQYQSKKKETTSQQMMLRPLKKDKAALPSALKASQSKPSILNLVECSIESCFNTYLEIFEKSYQEDELKKTNNVKVKRLKSSKSIEMKPIYIESEMQRWLRMFQKG